MHTNERTTRTARVWWLEDGIICARALPGIVQTLADAQENAQAEEYLAGGQRHALLVDMREIRSQDREAREFYAQPENTRSQSAVAILIGSPISRVIGNFFIGFNKPPVPTRIFNNEADALAWLREFRA